MKSFLILLVAVALLTGGVAFAAPLPVCHAPADLLDAKWAQYSYDAARDAELMKPCVLSAHPTAQDALQKWGQLYRPLEIGAVKSTREQWERACRVAGLIMEWSATGKEPPTWRQEHEAFARAMQNGTKVARQPQ